MPALYTGFKKRQYQYEGQRYGRWNKMKELRYLNPTHYDLLPHRRKVRTGPNTLPAYPPPAGIPKARSIPPKDIVEIGTEKIAKAAGSTIGFFKEVFDPNAEDKYQDNNEKNIGYLVATFVVLILLSWVLGELVKKF